MHRIDQSTIKNTNRNMIIKLLSKERELTKQNIAKKLEISIPTVSTIINELLENNIVEEAGNAGSTGGRKPLIIRFLPDSRFSIGIDLSLNEIRFILTDLNSNIIDEFKENIDTKNGTLIINTIDFSIKKMLNKNSIDIKKLLGIGVALPGTVNIKKKMLEVAANLGLKNLSFEKIGNSLSVPLFLENEAKAAAFAEATIGIAKEKSNLIFVSVAEGIGGGIIINQKLYRGKDVRAGEIVHTTINKNGRVCNCGRKGCWETYASKRALINEYNKSTGSNVINMGQIISGACSANKEAQEVINEYIDNLSVGIQNLMNIFDPDYIVIGGEISKYDFLLPELREKVFSNNAFYSEKDVEILFSSLGENSSILGASLIPIEEALNINNNILV
jgi:predicted NBD/HSP70 family sugar kinase